jgi:hypothetical protein
MEWIYQIVSDSEWDVHCSSVPNQYVNAIYISRSELEAAFSEDGRQILPLSLQLTGNVTGLITLFERCNWKCTQNKRSIIPYYYSAESDAGTDRI